MTRTRQAPPRPGPTGRFVLVALLSTALLACGQGGRETMLEDYLQRLGRSVSQPAAPPAFVRALGLPRLYDDAWTNSAPTIGLLEFMRLQACAVQGVIARRNSSLGRQAPPSQRLLNTIDFLRLAPVCIDALTAAGDDELAARLASAVQFKQEHLPRALWQAMLGSQEARAFWRQPPALADYPARTGAGPVVALESLTQLAQAWLAGDYGRDGGELEPLLQIVAGGDGGQLLYALGTLSDALARGDHMLVAARAAGPLCYFGRSNPRGEILFNVVRLYFIGEVQRWAAQLNQRYYALWPALQRLETLLAAGEPASYRQWRQQRDHDIERFRLAPRRHVEALHPLLAQCGLAPAAPAATCPDGGTDLPCAISTAEALRSARPE